MAYGMSAAKEAGLGGTQVWKRLMGMPVEQLKAAAKGEVPGVDMNMATLALRAKMTGVAEQGVKAQQQLAGGQGTVKDRIMAKADLPEMLGIGRLPAQNMEEMAYAEGGVVGYADGGLPQGYDPAVYEMFEDPTSGEIYPRKKVGALQAYGQRLQNQAQGIRSVAPVAPTATPVAAPAAPAAAPAAPAARALAEAPKAIKQATVGLVQPKAPVTNPTEAQKDNIDAEIGRIDKLTSYLDKKYGDQFQPIKDQLDKDRAEYANMKSENVGLALLGAAGALLKPGRSTASAIGEGLGTLAEYGTKFQPQMLAARQGISAGEIGLAQAQAQASRGNFGTAAQLVSQDQTRALQERELAAKEPLYRAQAGYYGAAAGAKAAGAGAGGAQLGQLKALQSSLQAQLKGLQGKVDPDSKAQAALIQQQLAQVSQRMSGLAGLDLNTGFVSKPGAGMNVTRSSLFEE